MPFFASLTVSVVLGAAWLAAGPGWQEHVPPNAAYVRAKQRPAFSMDAPVGLVASEETRQAQRDAAEKLRAALSEAQARGDAVFTIPPGEYRFSGNRGLVIDGVAGRTIVARDVTFWFERPASMLAADPRGLVLSNCRDVTIRGLKIDFDPPVYLQAEILAVDGATPGIRVAIDPDFPDAEMGAGSFFLYRRDGSWIRHGYLFHRGTRRMEGRTHRVEIADARVFEALREGGSPVGPGDHIVLPWRRGKGIHVYRCEGCTLEDVDEYASPGMGILEQQGKGGNVYRRVRIIPPPGTRRLHACAADGFHNAQTDRGPRLIECEIAGTSDDFFNLHGHFGVVWLRLDARRFVIGQANLGEIEAGETLTFYDDETVELLGKARATRIERLGDGEIAKACDAVTLPNHANREYHVVTLDREVALAVGDLAALDRFRSAGFLIQDCYFHDAMARCLINGAGDGRIVGNVVERSAWGLVVHFETWQYFEGPMPRNIEIAGNVFSGIRDPLLPHHATAITVTMVPTDGGYLRETRPLKGIEIVGNYIEEPGGFGIVVTNTEGASIADNTIVGAMYRPAEAGGDLRTIQFLIGHPNYFEGKARRAAIGLWSSSDVAVRGNRIVDPGGFLTHGPLQIGEGCERISVAEGE